MICGEYVGTRLMPVLIARLRAKGAVRPPEGPAAERRVPDPAEQYGVTGAPLAGRAGSGDRQLSPLAREMVRPRARQPAKRGCGWSAPTTPPRGGSRRSRAAGRAAASLDFRHRRGRARGRRLRGRSRARTAGHAQRGRLAAGCAGGARIEPDRRLDHTAFSGGARGAVSQSDMARPLPRRLATAFAGAYRLKLFEPPYPSPSFEIMALWHREHGSDPAIVWLRNVGAPRGRRRSFVAATAWSAARVTAIVGLSALPSPKFQILPKPSRRGLDIVADRSGLARSGTLNGNGITGGGGSGCPVSLCRAQIISSELSKPPRTFSVDPAIIFTMCIGDAETSRPKKSVGHRGALQPRPAMRRSA